MHSLMLTLRKIDRNYLDSDYILAYDHLQAYAPHVYDKEIYSCWPNNKFFCSFLDTINSATAFKTVLKRS